MTIGFSKIIARWRTTGRTREAEHVALALATFRQRHPQVLDNLAADRYVQDREDLLRQLLAVDPCDAAVVEGKVFAFSRSHQLTGPRNQTAQRASLGHVEERRKTEATLASVLLARSPLTRRNRSVGLLLDDILRRDLPGQQSLLDGCLLSRWLMWGFYQPRTLGDPFRGLGKQRSELVRRLGMGQTEAGQELLLWTHRLAPHQTAHKPTAFDAEAYEYFRPGGKTQPLSGTDGLHEVVHGPVAGSQLSSRIEKAL